jgi:hypothetical protein
LGDRKNFGGSSCNSDDGTGQMAQPFMLMMMMMVSHKQAYAFQQLACLGSDVILPLCFGVRAAICFSRRPTVGTQLLADVCRARGHYCLAPLVSDSVRSPVNTIALALKTKLCGQPV